MLDFFLNLDTSVQVAIITLCGGVLVALINGIVSLANGIVPLINNRKKNNIQSQGSETDKITINQTSNGHNNTFIGIQNNNKDGE